MVLNDCVLILKIVCLNKYCLIAAQQSCNPRNRSQDNSFSPHRSCFSSPQSTLRHVSPNNFYDLRENLEEHLAAVSLPLYSQYADSHALLFKQTDFNRHLR